ncbi:MAG: glycosyltransferase [Phycisphaerae bacterium]|nr:glycosyltransferase [Phycisphaerae bacterium]
MLYALQTACIIIFLVLMLVPGIYGIHLALLAVLAHHSRARVSKLQHETIANFNADVPDNEWPRVTTQIPLYNEFAVARRIITDAAHMDYPAGRHEVQVLDDSTDETRQAVDEACAELCEQGYNVKVVRRPTRAEYKAGALAHGMKTATGEYLAVFDADFRPDPGFLRRMIPLLVSEPRACCVQGRWGHLNPKESWVSESLALALDGHHALEQAGRSWNGLCLGFNGTGGIWRRAAIEDPDVGGWSGDTITEDLDLSYRAQMHGWHIVYCVDEVSPAELPADVDAMKTQQRRWAMGSLQTACKLLPRVWHSKLNLFQKLEASVHLTQYSISVFMLLMLGLGRLLLWWVPYNMEQAWLGWAWPLIPVMILAPALSYIYARWSIGGGWSGVLVVPKLIVMSLGLSINNTYAVVQGLAQQGGEFVRTPKSGSTGKVVHRQHYAALRSRLWLIEVAIGVACFFQWAVFLEPDHYVGGTFVLLYAIGLISLGWASRPRAEERPPQVAQTATIGASPPSVAA